MHSLVGDGPLLPAKITDNVRHTGLMSGCGVDTEADGDRVGPPLVGKGGAGPGKLTRWSLFLHSPVLCIHGSSPLQHNGGGKFGFS